MLSISKQKSRIYNWFKWPDYEGNKFYLRKSCRIWQKKNILN